MNVLSCLSGAHYLVSDTVNIMNTLNFMNKLTFMETLQSRVSERGSLNKNIYSKKIVIINTT